MKTLYRLIWKDLHTGSAGTLSPGPLTRQEALSLISRHTPHGATVLMMQPFNPK
jgi:hypothetical protein